MNVPHGVCSLELLWINHLFVHIIKSDAYNLKEKEKENKALYHAGTLSLDVHLTKT